MTVTKNTRNQNGVSQSNQICDYRQKRNKHDQYQRKFKAQKMHGAWKTSDLHGIRKSKKEHKSGPRYRQKKKL